MVLSLSPIMRHWHWSYIVWHKVVVIFNYLDILLWCLLRPFPVFQINRVIADVVLCCQVWKSQVFVNWAKIALSNDSIHNPLMPIPWLFINCSSELPMIKSLLYPLNDSSVACLLTLILWEKRDSQHNILYTRGYQKVLEITQK